MKLKRFLLVGVVLFGLGGCHRHPTDAALQTAFRSNYPAFSNIVADLRLAPDRTQIEWNGSACVFGDTLTNQAVVTTRLLSHFKTIGQPLFVVATQTRAGPQVIFYFSRRGISVSGSAKGIIYMETEPMRIVPDTDASSQTNAPFTVVRPLDKNWFIFYSR